MATFTVDPATLQELGQTLSRIHSEMQNMDGVAKGYAGRLGGPDLDGEVDHFCTHWNYGIGQLEDQMTKVVQHLLAAAATYAKCESEVTAAASPGKGT